MPRKGQKMSIESKERIRQSSLGRKFSDITREKLRQSLLGHKVSEDTRRKIVENRKIKHLTEEWKMNISKGNKGKIRSEEARMKYKMCQKGAKNSQYINGNYCRKLDKNIRETKEYLRWRSDVFKRDNYICQNCGISGCYIEAHHKKAFVLIFEDFLKEYQSLDMKIDKDVLCLLAVRYKPFWEIDNGLTLCRNCHINTRKRSD